MTTVAAVPDVVPLRSPTRPYAWGSPTAIPDLMGEEPTGEPVAELWIGAHPDAPSRWADHPGALGLDAVVAADPISLLGESTATRFAGRLPFLLKLLAADRALSLQVHPDLAQARAGFAREDSAGIARDAPERSYRDDNHKPELLCALTPFDALCGFRSPQSTLDLLATLDTALLDPLRTLVAAGPDLRPSMEYVLQGDPARASELAVAVTAAAAAAGTAGAWGAERRWLHSIGQQFPGDVGVVVAALLNLLRLQPGESVFLAAGQIHAYLEGVGVELLANSDNVLRCGLTPKHIDVAELLAIAEFTPAAGEPSPVRQVRPGERVYPVPVPDFELSRFTLPALDAGVPLVSAGPQLLLVTAGSVELLGDDGSGMVLAPGRAAFVPAGRDVRAVGHGTLFRTVVPGA